MNELLLDRNILRRVITDSGAERAQNAGGRSSGRGTITAEAIEDAMRANTTCRCTDLGLRPGMPADELIELESGCTGIDSPFSMGSAWVCEALDKLRRRYGR